MTLKLLLVRLGLCAEDCPIRSLGIGTEKTPFKAVLVFTDPADWARDLQLLVDVVRSGGVLGRAQAPAGFDTFVEKRIEHDISYFCSVYSTFGIIS